MKSSIQNNACFCRHKYSQLVYKIFLLFLVFLLPVGSILLAQNTQLTQNLSNLSKQQTPKVSATFQNTPIIEVFKSIEEQTHFVFSYNDNVLNDETTYSSKNNTQTVAEILSDITKMGYQFRQIGNNISVIRRNDQRSVPESVNGKVMDALTGDPLIGVNILVEGTSIGTVTDSDGEFILNIPDDATSLVVRYIGYKQQKLHLNQISEQLLIEMERDLIKGEELVVSGQGINMEKRRLSTNIVSIGAEEIEASPAGRLDQLLQSKIPNAQFEMTNGQPGSSSIIRGRGVVSAYLNSTPVIYIDGVRVDNLNTKSVLGGGSADGAATSSLADLALENIERIEYINGGAATTLYGSDAANGVIQIFTKKSGDGRAQFSFTSKVGSTTPTEDFLHFDRTGDLLYQTGLYQDHTISLSGGTKETLGYSFSGNITNDKGFRIEDQNENIKVNLRSGFTAQLNDHFTYRSSLGYSHSNFKRVRDGNAGGYTGLWYAESGASLFTGPGFNPNLNELSDEDYALMKQYVTKAEELQDNQTNINRFQTSQIIEYKPSDNLMIKATTGLDYRVQNEAVITTNEYLNHVDNLSSENGMFDRGRLAKYDRTFLGLTTELTAQHQAKVQDFSFITTAGGQFFRNEDHQVVYRGIDVRDGATSISQAATTEGDEYLSEVANYGLYAQENIGYKNRYFLEFGIRGDGNTAFGDNVGIQYYPKVGVSYLVSAEPFFLDAFSNSVFSYFKVKANYGVAGNFPDSFAHERTVAMGGFQNAQAATFDQLGNDNLKPEKIYNFEIGADLGFVQDRILLNANYYYTETRDGLFFTPRPPSAGGGTQLSNVGTIENKGMELSLTAIPILNKDWSVSLKSAFNTMNNKVVDTGGAGAFHINGLTARTIQAVVAEGYSIGYLRGTKGNFENGVMVSSEPMAFLKPTLPDYFGSFSLDISYKNIHFFANANYQMGAYAHSFDREFRFQYRASSDNEGIPDAEVEANGTSNWLQFTDRFIEKTDFLKVRTVALDYTINSKITERLADRVMIGFTVVNPFNFSSSSFDPEATHGGSDQGQNKATTGGFSYSIDSSPRRFLGTLKIAF